MTASDLIRTSVLQHLYKLLEILSVPFFGIWYTRSKGAYHVLQVTVVTTTSYFFIVVMVYLHYTPGHQQDLTYHLNMTTTQFVKLNLVDDQVYNASMTTTQFVVF